MKLSHTLSLALCGVVCFTACNNTSVPANTMATGEAISATEEQPTDEVDVFNSLLSSYNPEAQILYTDSNLKVEFTGFEAGDTLETSNINFKVSNTSDESIEIDCYEASINNCMLEDTWGISVDPNTVYEYALTIPDSYVKDFSFTGLGDLRFSLYMTGDKIGKIGSSEPVTVHVGNGVSSLPDNIELLGSSEYVDIYYVKKSFEEYKSDNYVRFYVYNKTPDKFLSVRTGDVRTNGKSLDNTMRFSVSSGTYASDYIYLDDEAMSGLSYDLSVITSDFIVEDGYTYVELGRMNRLSIK